VTEFVRRKAGQTTCWEPEVTLQGKHVQNDAQELGHSLEILKLPRFKAPDLAEKTIVRKLTDKIAWLEHNLPLQG
jgi:hypothetical protein